MAANKKNKFPSDKAGTKYSEFKNTKRTSPAKARTGETKQEPGSSDQTFANPT
jgi:hypothetical protein